MAELFGPVIKELDHEAGTRIKKGKDKLDFIKHIMVDHLLMLKALMEAESPHGEDLIPV